MADSRKMLTIYLNDHLAGATAGVELIKRTLSSNTNTHFGAFCEKLLSEVEEDYGTLQEVMAAVGAKVSNLKRNGAWLGEKLGRLKLNGQVTGYSDLSRVVETEGLCLGVEGKLSLWRSLARVAPSEPRLSPFDFDRLAERAAGQRSELEEHRLAAVDTMMSPH